MIAAILTTLLDTKSYFFWLLIVSLIFFVLERVLPRRPAQPALRPAVGQDLFWLVWNGQYAGILLAFVVDRVLWPLTGHTPPRVESVLSAWPVPVQFLVLLVVSDFLDWCVHNLLHRVPVLWIFHRLHHSVDTMDFLANFRFHWMEVVIYKLLKFMPLLWFGVPHHVALSLAVFTTAFGHFNHSNLRLEWPGPLRYILSSPGYHLWHHARLNAGDHGRNFAVVFSLWDTLFGAARFTVAPPRRLGFAGRSRFPRSIPARLLYPIPLPVFRRTGRQAPS